MKKYESMCVHDDLMRAKNHLRDMMLNEDFEKLTDYSKDHLNTANIIIGNVITYIEKIEKIGGYYDSPQ